MNADRNRYPCLEIATDKLKENLAVLTRHCHDFHVDVCGVVKGVSALPEVVKLYAESDVKWVASSRLDQLAAIREAGIDNKPLMLIRVPMRSELSDVVRLCDMSLQSDLSVLRATDNEARRQGKIHNVMLMLDLGDLREGFFGDEELLAAALEVETKCSHLHLAGIGTNLSCYGSVVPTEENLSQLVCAAEMIEKAIGRKIEWISGGESTSVGLMLSGKMPKRINMLRIGEFALLGGINDCFPADLHRDVFTLRAEVVECRDKPSYPIGRLAVDAFGRVGHYEERGIRRRAIVAVGRVDYGDCADITPRLAGSEMLGASSDHTILDVETIKDQIAVGDVLEFDVRYGALVHLTQTKGVRISCQSRKKT